MPLDVFSAVEQYHPQEIENLAVFDEKFVCGCAEGSIYPCMISYVLATRG